ncbi:hypothetical protein J8273_5248 [Carpediemonas membranifera]|uniref:cyclin-dependent kinase n=1 Tax=Carpediemonas membranifera TaxID=201153 RepID=A0A8J6ARP3_9EUKA|nr:hypothetical protein J8273_5248 [Carpediemonas membranifera]|eukprot:KAG9392263.1 hypothetical protein J8273_5248 [Carpediemonas membranifera]
MGIPGYTRVERVGQGTYAVVWKAHPKHDPSFCCAIKCLSLNRETDGIPATAMREISILRDLSHPNIVVLHEVVSDEDKLALVFEFVEHDLRKVLDLRNKRLPLNEVKSFMYQLLKGVAYCHKMKVLHRDLKPQNLLISANGVLKLADFGLARSCGIPLPTYTNEVVTLWYRPPDIILGNTSYNASIDMWSCGAIFAEMVTGEALFPGKNEPDELLRIFKVLGTPTEATWPSMTSMPKYNKKAGWPSMPPQKLKNVVPRLDQLGLDLLAAMLQFEPKDRMSAEEALQHPYFSGMH